MFFFNSIIGGFLVLSAVRSGNSALPQLENIKYQKCENIEYINRTRVSNLKY